MRTRQHQAAMVVCDKSAGVCALIHNRSPQNVGLVVRDYAAFHVTAVAAGAHHFAAIASAADDGALPLRAVMDIEVRGVDRANLAPLVEADRLLPITVGSDGAVRANSILSSTCRGQSHTAIRMERHLTGR